MALTFHENLMGQNNHPRKNARMIVGLYLISSALILGGIIFGAKIFKNEGFFFRPFQDQKPQQAQALAMPASKPVKISLPSINTEAAVTELGLQPDHTIEVPKDPNQVGWYVYSPTPGEIGPSVMVGHLDSATGPAIFWNLKDLKSGDQFTISRQDGSKATFQVYAMKKFSQDNFPSNDVYGPISDAEVRLITCSGTWLRSQHHYSDNLVVFAALVKTN